MKIGSTSWLTLAALLVLAGCAEDVTAPGLVSDAPIQGTRLATNGEDSLSTLVSCMAAKVRPVSKDLDRRGGELRVGSHVLTIPRDALRRKVRITAGVVDTGVVAIQLEPEGLQFLRPATLALDYRRCALPTDAGRVHVACVVVDGEPTVAEHLDATDDRAIGRVSTAIDHFSRYAVAW